MSTKNPDFEKVKVPADCRCSNATLFMIMTSFTFFSASMWAGQKLADGLDFSSFIWALILGGVILGAYTGLLGFIGAESGFSLDLLARRSFGRKGSWLPSAMIAFTQTGWFGVGLAMFAIPVVTDVFNIPVTPDSMPWQGYALVVLAGFLMTSSAFFGIKGLTIISNIAVPMVAILGTVAIVMAVKQGDRTLIEQFSVGTKNMSIIAAAGLVTGSFVSGGTSTPNFTRFGKKGLSAAIITVVAFFLGNSLMFFFGAVSSIYVGGNDIFEVMLNLNLFWLAIIVLGLNIWTTNDNAIYSSGLGVANITGLSKKTSVLVCSILATVFSVWLYWNFCRWLNILNCTLPPIGIILIVDYFCRRKSYLDDSVAINEVNWFSIIGVIAGAVVANLLDWGIASVNGMAVAVIIYLIGQIKAVLEWFTQKNRRIRKGLRL